MRFENFAAKIHKIIANTLLYKVSNEKLKTITITDISITPDRQKVTVYINSEKKEQAVKELNHIKGVFRRQIAHSIQSKYTPHINFKVDNLPEQVKSIEKTINEIKKNQPLNIINENNYKKYIE